MPKIGEPGFKGRIPLERLPLDKLPPKAGPIALLPDPVADADGTGFSSALHQTYGYEPWIFDDRQSFLMADLSPGIESTSLLQSLIHNGSVIQLAVVSDGGDQDGKVLKWNPLTRSFSTIVSSETAFPFQGVTIGGELLLLWADNSANRYFVSVYDSSSQTHQELRSFPNMGGGSQMQGIDGKLVVIQSNGSVYQANIYDPASDVWNTVDLAVPFAMIAATAGHYLFLTATDYGPGNHTLRVDLNNGTVERVFEGNMYSGHTIDGDTYTNGLNGAQSVMIKLDGQTGEVIEIPYLGNGAFLFGAQGRTLIYVTGDGNYNHDIIRVTVAADGSVTQENINVDTYLSDQLGYFSGDDFYIIGAEATLVGVNGANLDYGLYSLTADGTFTLVADLDLDDRIAGVVNGSVILRSDRDNDGDYQLWASSTPEVPSSWTMISPDDVDIAYFGTTVLSGDFLFT